MIIYTFNFRKGSTMKVSVVGTTGYGGIELLRILHTHPSFQIQSIHSTKDEIHIWDEYPHLYDILEKKIVRVNFDKISEESDLVFLATPSGVSSRMMEEFANRDIKVIDLSGDLRLKNEDDYRIWYKKEPAKNSIVQQAIYGLSEWHKSEIKDAKWIANPGCYSTASLLGLAPVVINKLIELKSIIIDAKSGVSGSGRGLSKTSMFAEVNENFRIYKVNKHQHTPEIEQQLKEWDENIGPITFSTHLLPITRGIMATIYVQLKENWKTEQLIDLYKEVYHNKPFVRIRPVGTYPSVKEVAGSNFCDIGLNVDQRTGRLTIVSVIDNLMKGAAGQAVQNANLMYGLDETLGLKFLPLYP